MATTKASNFKKIGSLSLINGGYLSDSKGNAITHGGFVAAQQRAHLLVTLATAMKGKTFESAQVDDFGKILNEVRNGINATAVTEYVATPKAPSRALQDQLKAEALAWEAHQGAERDNAALNAFLQEFNIIGECENLGLFFSRGVVKLEAIYTTKEIVKAAKTVFPVLQAQGASL